MKDAQFPNLEQVLNEYASALVDSLVSKGVSRSSSLANSAEVSKQVQPLFTVYEVLMNEYWYYIDQGRGKTLQGSRPGVVRDLIKEWIRQNNIQAEERNGKKPTQEQLAFLITRKIHRDGFPGRDFVSSVYEDFIEKIDEAFDKDIELNFSKFAKNIFE